VVRSEAGYRLLSAYAAHAWRRRRQEQRRRRAAALGSLGSGAALCWPRYRACRERLLTAGAATRRLTRWRNAASLPSAVMPALRNAARCCWRGAAATGDGSNGIRDDSVSAVPWRSCGQRVEAHGRLCSSRHLCKQSFSSFWWRRRVINLHGLAASALQLPRGC